MNYESTANMIARKYGIPVGIFRGLITAESTWNPDARGITGAIGLTQVMPETAKSLGFEPADLASNPVMQLEAGAKYLSSMYELFQNWDHALAAYNAGPHNVRKHKGIPPFKETQNYVKRVLVLAQQYDQRYDKKGDDTILA